MLELSQVEHVSGGDGDDGRGEIAAGLIGGLGTWGIVVETGATIAAGPALAVGAAGVAALGSGVLVGTGINKATGIGDWVGDKAGYLLYWAGLGGSI